MMNLKSPPIRDAKHVKKVRDMACEITGRPAPSDPAHVRKGGNGGGAMKPGDDRLLPLNHDLHAEQHQIGEVSFYLKYMTLYSDFMMRCVQARAKEIYMENQK